MPTWPLTLPQSFLVNGLREEGTDNVIRSPIDTGPAKTRRRYSAKTKPIQGSMLMTQAQYLIFKTFYEDTIADGALEFDMPDDVEGGTMTVKVKDKYQADAAGIHWLVALDLDRQP